jgi:hypothetical protein
MILLLDFYFLAAIIGAFSVSCLQSIERRNNPNNTEFSDRAVTFALLSPLYIGYVTISLNIVCMFNSRLD